MGSHDQAQIAALAACDPERAIVTALERAERAAPGSLSPEALARVAAWREAELARKAQARSITAEAITLSSAERPDVATVATEEVSGG